ncbi:hypothetical protein MML48_1g04626 [Holotrichia oblita]|nr:hypothetical protein MML48_1g16120 [Holotrichia oblita]KAI4470281.1 hypothetical protein MML48_1g04626 [Holotrichia oblita]
MSLAVFDRSEVSHITSPSPKGIKHSFIQAISKKFIRKSREDLQEDDSRSSTTDSSLSSPGRDCSRSRKSNKSPAFADENSLHTPFSQKQHILSSSSDVANSGMNVKNKRYYSTSADSIMRVFENLTISTRSRSCSGADKDKKEPKKKKKPPPKRILRSPVKYVYAKGWSGLPTQRIPVSRKYTSYPGGCRVKYIGGLNR